jgi:hypothetical protein
MRDYCGAIHIHSEYSFDGNTKVGDIVRAAKGAGLDFIVLTDHFRMDARRDGWEGWRGGVLVLVGEEISPRYNHYLALGIEKPVIAWKKSSKPQEYIDEVNRQGGIGFIAHPDHTGAPKFGIWEYPWKDWSVKGYAAVSIWDMMTDWQEKLSSVPRALWAFASPAGALAGPKKQTLARWDELNRTGKVAGYGEIDNHNSIKRYFGINFRIFPFERAFRTIRTHLLIEEELSPDAKAAEKQVIEAVKARRLYVAQEHDRPAKGFMFRIYGSEATAYTGGEFKLGARPALLEAKIPSRGLIRVIRDGETIFEHYKTSVNIDLDRPGVYRIEAYYKKYGRTRPWIFSNPIWVS